MLPSKVRFLVLELVWIYDKLNRYAKKVSVMGTLRREETLSLSCAHLKSYPCINEKKIVNYSKRAGGGVLPQNYQFFRTLLASPPPSSPSCTQEGRSILERGVQNCPYPSSTVIKPFMYPWKKWSLQRDVHILLPTYPPPPPSPPHTHTHTHTHTHAPNPWYTLKWKSSLQKGVYMLLSRAWLEVIEFGAGASF